MLLQFKRCFQMASFLLFSIVLHGCAEKDTSKEIALKKRHPTGYESKWNRAKSFQIEDYHVTIGFLNDDYHLYIRLVTTNNDIKQRILTSGCTIWIDSDGGLAKVYGIHYPSIKAPEVTGYPAKPPALNNSNKTTDGVLDKPASQAMEIVSNDGSSHLQITGEEAMFRGIETVIKDTDRYLMYDLTIPYTEIIPLYDPKEPALPQSIAVALEIEEVTPVKNERSKTIRNEGKEQRGQGKRGGGGRGGGGKVVGEMTGGKKSGKIDRKESYGPGRTVTFEKWFIVDL